MNRRMLRAVLRETDIPVFVVDVDRAGDVVRVAASPARERDAGLRVQSILGKGRESIWPAGTDEATLAASCRRCLGEGRVTQFEEPSVVRGSAARWLTQVAPVRDATGRVVRAVGISVDITGMKLTEGKLREGEERFRAIADCTSDWESWFGPDGRLRWVNPAVERLAGYSPAECCAMPGFPLPVVHPEDRPAMARRFAEARGGSSANDVSFRIQRKDGATRWAAVSWQPILDAQGRNLGYRTSVRDVTERMRTEDELRQSSDLLRAIIEAAPTAIIGLDLDGNVRMVWNPAAEKMLGWKKEEAMGRLLPSVPLESQEEFRRFLDGVREGRFLDGVEVRRQRRDGTPIDYSIYASPLHDAEGRVAGNIAVLVDTSARKQAENLLHAREEEFRALAENSPDFVARHDQQGRILYGNPAAEAMIGHSMRGLLGRTLTEVAPGDGWAQSLHARILEVLDTGSPVEAQVILDAAMGRGPPCLDVRFVPERDRSGQIVSVLSIGRDVSALREAERRLRTLVESFPDMIARFDWDRRFAYANPALCRISGIPTERLIGKTAAELFPAATSTGPSVADLVKEAFNRGVPGSCEASWSLPDGEATYDLRLVPEQDEDGKVVGVIGIGRDITVRRRAENALRRSEKEKTLLSEIARIFLTVPDEAVYGQVVTVVLRTMESRYGLFGYVAENGDLVVPSLTDASDLYRVSQAPIVFRKASWKGSPWARAIQEQEAFLGDGPFRTPEGHARIEHVLAAPIVFGGATIGLLAFANKAGGYAGEDRELVKRIADSISPILNARLQRDMQERRRKEAEAALRESEEKYRVLVANAGEAVFVVQDDVVKFPNAKALEMSGYGAEALAKTRFTDLVHPDDRQTVRERYLERLHGEDPTKASPFRIKKRTGEEIWVQLTSASIAWEGKPGALCFLRDVTEEKNLETQSRQAQKMEAVGHLAGGIAHDFNNMLSVINGFSEMALASLHAGDPIRDQLQEILRAGRRAAALTRQLLAFSRSQVLAPEVLDLDALVCGMESMLKRLIGEDIDLLLVQSQGPWRMKADRGQIEQVILNLAVNARDAMPGGGRLTIETAEAVLDEPYVKAHLGARPGPHVMLAITDNGRGMDRETQSRMFEPFFTTKEPGKGTGLGLATVYGIVKQSGGSIWVYSEVGTGTTFKVYFPRVCGTPTESRPSGRPARRGGGETVLVVEDEDAVRGLAVQMLERGGYKVIAARNGEEALLVCERYPDSIDLLLTDVVMPQMGGRELAGRVARSRPALKVLFMSGYTDRSVESNGLLDAGSLFLRKPFSEEELLVRVRAALDEELRAPAHPEASGQKAP